ncbi:hypothetical protein OHA40_30800 [Nocardia sp. NBC_00508]|uniref:hypothetical protein n=1 Tax=Nocardia sp. NBC_00508 TaxID=2975992 RepID=UPI002E7FE629|nr:hypothetical protein [Nocardia sp. NBC_00508]WUD65922.1 hypothetical protein OHA40_30800 [Nocardia sp. NBC_00508]
MRKLGRSSLVIASKHPMPEHPLDTLDAELRDGYAVWSHITDDEHPQLVLISAGDIAAHELSTAATATATAIAAARPNPLPAHPRPGMPR